MNDCSQCVVRNQAVCAALSLDELEVLNKKGRHMRLKAGQSFFLEGDDAPRVANVIEGVLKLSSSTADGREQIVGVLYPSDFIGRPYGGRTTHSVTALSDAHVCAFSSRDFEQFARSHPELEHKLLERTLEELDRTRNWLMMLGRLSAGERIAAFIYEMGQRIAGKGCKVHSVQTKFEFPFGRQQIADILGLTIETVSRQMKQLEREQVIALPSRREIEILDADELKMRATLF